MIASPERRWLATAISSWVWKVGNGLEPLQDEGIQFPLPMQAHLTGISACSFTGKLSYTDTCLKPGSKPTSKPTRVSRFRQHASVGRPLQDLEDSKIVSLFSIMSVADHLF
jgi:hypothetical protein